MSIYSAELVPDGSAGRYYLGDVQNTGSRDWREYLEALISGCEEVKDVSVVQRPEGSRIFRTGHRYVIAREVDLGTNEQLAAGIGDLEQQLRELPRGAEADAESWWELQDRLVELRNEQLIQACRNEWPDAIRCSECGKPLPRVDLPGRTEWRECPGYGRRSARGCCPTNRRTRVTCDV